MKTKIISDNIAEIDGERYVKEYSQGWLDVPELGLSVDSVQEQIDKKEKELKELKEKQRAESEKDIWLEIPEKGIKITTKLQFTNKTYPDILKEVDESEIADYPLLQDLRNEGYNSNWEKYGFLKDTWAFVPNPDKVSKANGRVARFNMNSGDAYLDCWFISGNSGSALGVFLIKKISRGKQCKKKLPITK